MKKKETSRHTTPRTPVQFPNDWLKIARELAAEKRQPVSWYLLSLLESAALDSGREKAALPALPWE